MLKFVILLSMHNQYNIKHKTTTFVFFGTCNEIQMCFLEVFTIHPLLCTPNVCHFSLLFYKYVENKDPCSWLLNSFSPQECVMFNADTY